MTTPLLISIDWDYFIYNGADAVSQAERWTDWDWSHSEHLPASIELAIWHARASAIRCRGQREDEFCTVTEDVPGFLDAIRRRVKRPSAQVLLADSHSTGYPIASQLADQHGGPIELLLFDAHNDLGYGKVEVDQQAKDQHTDCATWVWHAIRCGHISKATIVYPEWRGLDEYREWVRWACRSTMGRAIDSRVKAVTWNDWLRTTTAISPSLVHIVRSGAWTPPWLDDQFCCFASLAANLFCRGRAPVCLNCASPEDSAGRDACKPRKWDAKDVASAARAQRKAIKQFVKSRKAVRHG